MDPFRQEAAEQFRLGQLAMDREEYSEAVERFGEATRRCWEETTYVQWYTRACEALAEQAANKKQEHADKVQHVLRVASAERYWIRGCKARKVGVWKEAMSCFEGAASLVPENEEYATALEEARLQVRDATGSTRLAAKEAQIAEAEEKAAPVRAARRKVSLWLVAGLVLAAVGYVAPELVAEPERDLRHEFADVAQFERLHKVPGFGWSGTIAIDTTGWNAAERQQACSDVVEGLPSGGSLLLSTADGYAVMCQSAPPSQVSEASP